MKKIFNDTFLHSTLKMSLCFAVLSCFCLTNVNAQDEIEGDEVVALSSFITVGDVVNYLEENC